MSWFSTTLLNNVVEVMTSGLPQDCKLWLGISKGMLPVEHLAPKILKIMDVNDCGRHLPTIERKVQPRMLVGASLACSMTGSLMSGVMGVGRDVEYRGSEWKKGDVCEEYGKRMIDACSLQEVRWRGQGARMLGMKGRRYRLWWSGKRGGVGGVGVMVMKELC